MKETCVSLNALTRIPEGKIFETTNLRVQLGESHLSGLNFLAHYPFLKRLNLCLSSCFSGNRQRLEDLSGIENCLHLEDLEVRGTDLISFRPIEYCSELRAITIENCLIHSFDVLELLPSLKCLKLSCIVNKSFLEKPGLLSQLRNLEVLEISGCQLTDLQVIEGLQLKCLGCCLCSLTSLRGLNVGNLEYLSIPHNAVKNIETLNHALKLRYLRLCDNSIGDIGPINWVFGKDVNITMHNAFSGPIENQEWFADWFVDNRQWYEQYHDDNLECIACGDIFDHVLRRDYGKPSYWDCNPK